MSSTDSDPTAGASPTPADWPTLPLSSEGAKGALGEGVGSQIGPYRLLQTIGEGGFGSVFLAEQSGPVSRRVALKIIRLGMDTREVVARFEQERQALAILDHPNIAKVFDAGATDSGRPYFVMELCAGEPIDTYCDRNSLSIEDRLLLFAQVCSAVQHAHTKGIIHRDIKPSNVLVSQQDGSPCAKVIDFGVAKATSARLTDRTLFTEHHQFIGTPEYMSPEQAEGSLDIDTRTDVYALGVMLYQLLTGTTPFSARELRSAALAEIQRIIREVDPPRPSTRLSKITVSLQSIAAQRRTQPERLTSAIRGELDWIVMKALEKDRQRRYGSPSEFASDIRRYLASEAVLAAPPSAGYRMRKFIRRHRAAALACGAVLVALVAGIIAFGWQARIARAQRDRAVAAETATGDRARELLAVSKFQGKMLSQIDVAEEGRALVQGMRAQFEGSLEREGVPADERARRSGSFADDLRKVNATDAAKDLIERAVLAPAAKAIDAQFKDQPLVDASLRDTLATVYKTIGLTDQAVKLETQALDTRRRLLGSAHPDTLESALRMARVLGASGRLPEAETLYVEAYEGLRAALGEDNLTTVDAMQSLGNHYREMERFPESEPLLRGALERNRRLRGDSDRDTLSAMNMMGYWYIEQGRLAEAEPLWREAYETGLRVYGPDDRDVLVWTNNLGGLLQGQGKLDDATPFLVSALDGFRRALGEDHPDPIAVARALAFHWQRMGKPAEAELLYRDALERSERTLGAENPLTVTSQVDFGQFLMSAGKLAEAEPLITDALTTSRKLYGPDHSFTLESLAIMARLRAAQGNREESEAIHRSIVDSYRRTLGSEHPKTLEQIAYLATLLLETGRTAEAEPLAREAVDTRARTLGDDHFATITSRTNLARVHELQGQLELAEAEYRDILERFARLQGRDHPNSISAMSNLASVLRTEGKLEESASLLSEAAAAAEVKHGKNHLRTATIRVGLGRTLTELHRFPEAERELAEADAILAVAEGVTPDRRRRLAAAMVALYDAWATTQPDSERSAKAAEWKERLAAFPDPDSK